MLLKSQPLPKLGREIDKVIDFIKPFLNYENGPWLAGGSLRRIMALDFADTFDVDVFVKNVEQRRVMDKVKANYAASYRLYPQPHPIQVTFKEEHNSLEQLLENFDFTACQFVSDGNTIRYSEQTMYDAEHKLLRMVKDSKVKDINRIMRYSTYGFNAQPCVLDSIADYQLSSVNYYKLTSYTTIFDDFVKKAMMYDMDTSVLLSLVGDIVFERFDNDVVAFVAGAPFPASLALVYLFCPNTRQEISDKLTPLWKRHKVNETRLHNSVSQMQYEQFIHAYRQFDYDNNIMVKSNISDNFNDLSLTNEIAN